MASLQCVFRPTTPWKTCTPASSMLRAQRMFEASSKRAISSTTTRRFLGRRGLGQRLKHRRVVAGAVERLLHGHHGRVLRALLDELDHRIVRVVGMVQQNVAVAQLVKDSCRLAAQQQRLGREGRELQVRPLHVAVKKHQPRKVHRPLAAKDLVLVELEVHAQPLHNLRVARRSQSPAAPRRPCGGCAAPRGWSPAATALLPPRNRGWSCASRGTRRAPAPRSRDTCRPGAARSGPAAAGNRSGHRRRAGAQTAAARAAPSPRPAPAGRSCARLARSSSARHSALFSTRGNGCAGSIEIGVSSGSTSR